MRRNMIFAGRSSRHRHGEGGVPARRSRKQVDLRDWVRSSARRRATSKALRRGSVTLINSKAVWVYAYDAGGRTSRSWPEPRRGSVSAP
jgi:hypothetical protein